MYEASDIKVGQVLLCVEDGDYQFWTAGKAYEIEADDAGDLYVTSDDHMRYFLKSWGDAWVDENFDIKKADFLTEFKAGMTLTAHVTQYAMEGSFFTDGNEYPVFEAQNGELAIRSDLGTPWFSGELTQLARAGFTFTEKRSQEKKIIAGMVIQRINDNYCYLTEGKSYVVYETESGTPYIIDDENDRYLFYNTEFVPNHNFKELKQQAAAELVEDAPEFKYDLHIQTNDVREFGRILDKFLKLVLEEQNAELTLEWAESALQQALEEAK